MSRRRWLLPVALVATTACAAILGIKPEASQERAFEHHEHAVAGVHCLNCHDGIRKTGETGELNIPSKAACVKCHEKPHDQRECGDCHGLPFARGGAMRAREVLRFDHAKHRTETKTDCVRCHADAGSGAAILRPKMAECLSCHGHDDEFMAKDCQACHVDLQTEGTVPEDHFVHSPTFGSDHASVAAHADSMCATCHSERTCAACHAGDMMPAAPERLAFDTPGMGGLHAAGFLARHADESANAGGLCTSCHAPESCSSCHEREQRLSKQAAAATPPSINPHPAGWIGPPGAPNLHGPAVWRDPAGCEACHGGAGEQLCVSCHAVGAAGGNPHAPGSRPRGDLAARPCVACHLGGR
ncbi:MAG: hypothetical protein IPM79_28545 [Polyangiaceae bacterium]|jgi:hypothetical protein|nr:hypothetical protein [Polyangiaceae bacterium]